MCFSDAGPDYDEFLPVNLCDGRPTEGSIKTPVIIDVCEKHDAVPKYDVDGARLVSLNCTPEVEIVFIRGKCRLCTELKDGKFFDPFAEENNQIVRKPKLTLMKTGLSSYQPNDGDKTIHIPQIPWRDPSFRMPDYSVAERKTPLEESPPVSPDVAKPPCVSGIVNPEADPEFWVDIDSRPIDFLENHYDTIGDRPLCKVDRNYLPVVYHEPYAESSHSDDLPLGSQAPQEGGSEPRKNQGESQPNDSNGASQPNGSGSHQQGHTTQGTTQAKGAATGGDEPPPPPRQNLNKFHGLTGNYRKRGSSESTKSSKSPERPRESSPDRPVGAALQAPAQTSLSVPPQTSQEDDRDTERLSPQSDNSLYRGDDDNLGENREYSLREQEEDRRTAELPARLEDWRQNRTIDSVIAHNQIEDGEDDEDLFLVATPQGEVWIDTGGNNVYPTLAQWERLLADPAIVHAGLLTQARAQLREQWENSRATALTNLRQHIPSIEHIVAQGTHNGRDVYLTLTDNDVIKWLFGNGQPVDYAEWERLIQEAHTHIYNQELARSIATCLEQARQAGELTDTSPNASPKHANDDGEESPTGEASSPLQAPPRFQLTNAEQADRMSEFRRRLAGEGIPASRSESERYLEAAGWNLDVAWGNFYADQDDEEDEPPQETHNHPDFGPYMQQEQEPIPASQSAPPVNTDDPQDGSVDNARDSAEQEFHLIATAYNNAGRAMNLGRHSDGLYWTYVADGTRADVAENEWEELLAAAYAYDSQELKDIKDEQNAQRDAAMDELTDIFLNNGFELPAWEVMIDTLRTYNNDAPATYDYLMDSEHRPQPMLRANDSTVGTHDPTDGMHDPTNGTQAFLDQFDNDGTPAGWDEPTSPPAGQPDEGRVSPPLLDPATRKQIANTSPQTGDNPTGAGADDGTPSSDMSSPLSSPPSSPETPEAFRPGKRRQEEDGDEEKDEPAQEPTRPTKRRRLNTGGASQSAAQPRRPWTRSMGAPRAAEPSHHMNLRSRRAPAPAPTPAPVAPAPSRARRATGAGRQAVGTKKAPGTTSKGKPRSNAGVQKPAAKKRTTRRTPAQAQSQPRRARATPRPSRPQGRTRAHTRWQSRLAQAARAAMQPRCESVTDSEDGL